MSFYTMSRTAIVIVFLIQCINMRVQCRPPPPGGGQHRESKKTTKEIYNPHYGFEPYWDNGDWVFKHEKLPPGVTTTSIPMVCGEECLEIYTGIGKVCGRQTSYIEYEGCSPNFLSWFCSGIVLDEQSKGYETFDSYCKFLDRQCRVGFEERWILVHPGPCVKPQLHVFRPFSISDLPINRMTFYLTSIASLFNNYTIDHPIFNNNN